MNLGKSFEMQFREDWSRCFPEGLILRLPDVIGYKSATEPCDFVCFVDGILNLIECKEHKGWSIPWSAMPQIERLAEFGHKDGVRQGFVIWYSERDAVVYCPLDTVLRLQEDGYKSLPYKEIAAGLIPDCIILPSRKKKVYLETDYTSLIRKSI